MKTKVIFDEQSRSALLDGAEVLYNAVKTTMGPKGRNVVIYRGTPIVTHDGVTVARAVRTTGDKAVGAELIKQAASKMNDVAGDGTTTVTVLTYHILNEANKLIAAGHNPMILYKELQEASKQALKSIKHQPITSLKEMEEVAYISCGDQKLGSLIAGVVEKVGKDGVVTVETHAKDEVETSITNGFVFDSGIMNPYFNTSPTKNLAELDDPFVLVYDGKISDIQAIMPALDLCAQKRRTILLVAEEFSADVLANLVLNKVKGVFSSCPVTIPTHKRYLLEDISLTTGATLFGGTSGLDFETLSEDDFGHAKRVVTDRDSTTIVEGKGNLTGHLTSLQSQNTSQSKARLAALEGKVAVIKVGGLTETEIEEKKFRVDDAVGAVKAALDEGIVAGGGVTLLDASRSLSNTFGAQLLCKALQAPFNILMDNSGINAAKFIDDVGNGKVIDIRTEKLVDAFENGIVDPAKVTKEAIKTAVSIAGLGMTTGALIVEEEDNETKQG